MAMIPGRLVSALSHSRPFLRSGAIGAGLGAAGSLFENALDGKGDHFDGKDTLKDAAFGGALYGGLGGLGSVAGASEKFGMKALGKALHGAGILGALSGPDWHPGTTGADAAPDAAPSLLGASPAAPDHSIFDGIMSFFGGDNVGEPPAAPTMTFSDYMKSKALNGIADSQIAQQVNPLNRQIEDIRRDQHTDEANNITLGTQIDNQMGQIGREDGMQSRAINDDQARIAQTARDEATQSLKDAGATSAGDASQAARTAAQGAEDDARYQAQRMADSELLKRLGVNSSEAINEMRDSEKMTTGQNAVKIRTSADDAVTETRGKISDAQAARPGILGSLANGMMDSSIAKHQAALGSYQAKLSAAKDKADSAQGALTLQLKANAAGSAGMDPKLLAAGSGFTAMNGQSGHADSIPNYALLPVDQAQAQGPEFYSMWQAWQPMVQGLLSGQ